MSFIQYGLYKNAIITINIFPQSQFAHLWATMSSYLPDSPLRVNDGNRDNQKKILIEVMKADVGDIFVIHGRKLWYLNQEVGSAARAVLLDLCK